MRIKTWISNIKRKMVHLFRTFWENYQAKWDDNWRRDLEFWETMAR